MNRPTPGSIDLRSAHRVEGMVIAASCSALLWAAIAGTTALLLSLR